METIETKEQLTENASTIEQYLSGDAEYEYEETVKLIRRGKCFLAYKTGSEFRFAPSRFVGYKKNYLDKHQKSHKDGRVTNVAINKVLGVQPVPNQAIEDKYLHYCKELGINPDRKERKYWLFDLEEDFAVNQLLSGEFPEGKVVERKHKTRERSSAVVELAKQNFKSKHGRLFCQVCGFDFEKRYGKIGKGFIEGHHIIPVSEMKSGHKTKPEDIALLCSNCHSMVHKRRPWLKMPELKSLIANT
jgi:5-methylcytosine-specific restriction protein A